MTILKSTDREEEYYNNYSVRDLIDKIIELEDYLGKLEEKLENKED